MHTVIVWHKRGESQPESDNGMSAMSLKVQRIDAIHPKRGMVKGTVYLIPDIAVDKAETVLTHFGEEFLIRYFT